MQDTIDLQAAGQQLAALIEQAGFTNRSFSKAAADAGISLSEATIRMYVRGGRNDEWPFSPKRKTIRKFADVFGLPTGIKVLKLYGYDDMIEQFKADHQHTNTTVDLNELEQRVERIERLFLAFQGDMAEQLTTIRRAVEASPGSSTRKLRLVTPQPHLRAVSGL